MESANFHHQLPDQQQQQQLLDSSTHTSCYGNLATNHSNWTTQHTILNGPMIQDLGFQWTNNSQQSAHDLQQLARIKEELSESYPRFTEMLNSPTSSTEDLHLHRSSFIKNDNHPQQRVVDVNLNHHNLNDLSHEKILLRSFSGGCQINGLNQLPPGEFIYSNNTHSQSGNGLSRGLGTFSQIFPTVNISNLNQSSTAISSGSLDMNLPALDLISSARFNGSFSQPSSVNAHLFKDNCLPYGLDQMQQLNHRPANSPSKISSAFTTGGTEAKRPSNFMETKATTQAAAPKKSRLESRSSCPPFKVRKEKLGDRISALQQLVAPFGKTDTASVLMEAIGYIKFLQNQVETLSVPYMKSTHKKPGRATRGGTTEEGNEDGKRDLRSRGLCLVPLSCLSYVTDGGGGVWPTPNFPGGT